MAKPRSTGLPQGAWVLVADGEKALFLVNRGDDQDMFLDVMRKEEHENPQAQEWAANRPGRFNDGPGVHRSAVQDTDWHQLEKERFASDLADYLYKRAHEGAFDKLAIAASRPALAELRDNLHKEVLDRIILDVPKVLTNHPIDEIEHIISKEIESA
jgi:protein required for attachment to host cells